MQTLDGIAVPGDLAQLLDEIRTDFPAILHDNLVGIYLWGSLTCGAFDEACSDVDFVCVTRHDLDDRQFQELDQWFAGQQARSRWVDRIDMRFVVDGEFLDKTSRCCGYYPFRGRLIRHESDGNPIIWINVAQSGITLWGGDARLIAPRVSDWCLSDALLLELSYLKETLAVNVGDRSDRAFVCNAYVVLTACRILYSACHRALTSKDQASEWAMKATPPAWWEVIHSAKANRLTNAGATTPQAEQDAMAFVRFVTDEVTRILRGSGPT